MEQFQINPIFSGQVPELRKRVQALPNDVKVCPKHGKEVVIGPERNFKTAGYTGAVPNWEVYFEACCAEAFGNVQLALAQDTGT